MDTQAAGRSSRRAASEIEACHEAEDEYNIVRII